VPRPLRATCDAHPTSRPVRRALCRVALAVPARFNIADACSTRWAADRTRFALYWEDEGGATAAYTYWDLDSRANRLANALRAGGVGCGDRVALILPQRPETVVAHLATYKLGAVAVPLSFLFGPDALEYRLATVAPRSRSSIRSRCRTSHRWSRACRGSRGGGRGRRARIVRHALRNLVEGGARHFETAATRPTDPALLVYTSGTTARPRAR